MARAKRFLPPDTPAHLVNRAVNRQLIFRNPEDFEGFMGVLGEARSRCLVSLLGYCVMPNHFHLLAMSPDSGGISRYMHWLTSTHALRHHLSRSTVGLGHVYKGRFWGDPIESEQQFFEVLRYVEANALRAGLVQRAEDWQWSSAWERRTGLRKLLAPLPTELPANWFELLNKREPWNLNANGYAPR